MWNIFVLPIFLLLFLTNQCCCGSVVGDRDATKPTFGDVKIDSDGRVLVFMYGVWGSIRAKGFDDAGARVVCKLKNTDQAKTFSRSLRWEGPQWIHNISCFGHESSLQECKNTTTSSPPFGYDYEKEAFVQCFNKTDVGTYRLSHTHYGEVLLEKNGKTGYVCDRNGFSLFDAKTLCYSLGFMNADLYPVGQFPANTGFWETTINCNTFDEEVDLCVQQDTWRYLEEDLSGTSNETIGYCRKNTASVFCYDKVRLHLGFLNSSGAVLRYEDKRKFPRTYCGDNFDSHAAHLVCKKLGFTGPSKMLPFPAFINAGYGVRFSMNCSNASASLDQCTTSLLPDPRNCESVAAVSCSYADDPSIQIPDGSVRVDDDGRVLVMQHGIWGSVSSEGWGDEDAKVVCKQSGRDSWKALTKRYKRIVERPQWYFNVNCTGSEKNLSDCPHDTSPKTKGMAANSYPRLHDAYVYCFDQKDVGTYSLTNGHYGRVQVERNSKKAYLCNPGRFSFGEADELCRSLGFVSGETYVMEMLPEKGNQWWKTTLECGHGEPSFDVCAKDQWDFINDSSVPNDTVRESEDCHLHTPAVFCYGKVRLHTSFFNSSGIVLVTNGRLGYCAEGFGSTEASLVCKQLGFTGTSKVIPWQSYTYLNERAEYKLTCPVGAKSLDECTNVPTSQDICPPLEVAAVFCGNMNDPVPEPNGTVRIEEDGRVLLMQDGVWGSVCSEGWDDRDARVVCKLKNSDSARAVPIVASRNDKPYYISDVQCNGTEQSLWDCRFKRDSASCFNKFDAYVNCYNKTEVGQYSLSHGHYGTVQLTRNGILGNVCGQRQFSYAESRAACQTLGFITGKPYLMPRLPLSGNLWWKNVIECRDGENMLDRCLKDEWQLLDGTSGLETRDGKTESDCNSNTAAVFCSGKVKFAGDGFKSAGVVLEYHNGYWLAFCADGFSALAAKFVCKELGFNEGRKIPSSGYYRYLENIRFSKVICPSNATSFEDCQRIYRDYSYRCRRRHYAAVHCSELISPQNVSYGETTTEAVIYITDRNNVTIGNVTKTSIRVSDKTTTVMDKTTGFTTKATRVSEKVTDATHPGKGITNKQPDVNDGRKGGSTGMPNLHTCGVLLYISLTILFLRQRLP